VRVFDLFSKRLRDEARSGATEVFQYEEIPESLRRQIRKIAQDGIGVKTHYGYSTEENRAYHSLRDILCREYGRDWLVNRHNDPHEDFMEFMLQCTTPEFLDCTELIAVGMDRVTREYSSHEREKWETGDVDELLQEIDYRFRRAGVGYQLAGTKVVRVDSQIIHSEVVKPALSLLRTPGYEGAQQEFLDAFKHLKDGNYREAIADASNAFESAMRAVCEKKGWTYPANPRASDLIKILKSNGLFPDYLGRSFDQLIATLASGLPSVRDSSAAHGQGATIVEVPEHVAAYSLHLAAAKIVLIVSAAENCP
jgi:hypothetical protein